MAKDHRAPEAGKRQAEKTKKGTDFKEAACCSSAVDQRAARRKNGLREGSARGN